MAPVETEAKFSFRDETAFAGWLTAPSLGRFSLGPVRVKHTDDHYLDSAQHACLAAGYACRVRFSGGSAVVTLKSLADVDGAARSEVRRRAEYEVELQPPEPPEPPAAGGRDAVPDWQQPAAWPESEARDLALRLLHGAPLVHLTRIRQERHEREVRDGERLVALLTLDRVSFDAGQPPLLELEAELAGTGHPEDLDEIVPVLRGDPAFETAARSKLLTALQGTALPPFPLHQASLAREGRSPAVFDAAWALRLLDALGGEAAAAGGRTLLAGAVRLLYLGAEAQPEDPGAAARDLLLAGPSTHAAEEDRLPLAAILGLQSLLDAQVREGGRPRLGRKRAAGDPAFATLSGPDGARARRLAVVLFTARRLGTEALPVFTVTERRVTMAAPAEARSALEEIAPLWQKTLGQELVLAGDDGRRRLGLRYDQTLASAGRAVLVSQLERLRHSAAELEGEDEVEALHDARVATRRIRTLLRLLKDAFPRSERRRHLRTLKRAGDLLGAVRDLDVLIGDAQAEQALRGETPGMRPLIGSWEEERRRARGKLLTYLEGGGFQATLPAIEAFAAAASTGKRGEARLCDELPVLVWQRYGAVRAYQPHLRTASLVELHELRKDVKQLRYLLEFFAELLGEEVESLVGRCVRVQDALGVLHDAVARRDRMQEPPRETQEDAAVGAYRLLTLSEITRRRRAFEELWPAISGRAFRRDLAAALAAL